MGQLKQLAGQTVIYGASSILGRLLNYLLVPLYTAVFAVAEYGVVTELYAIVAFLNVIYTYGFETAYFRFASKSETPSHYFNVAQTSLILTSVVLSALLALFSADIAEALEYPGRGHLVTWLAIIMAVDAVVVVPFAKLRLQSKAVKFAGLKLMNISANIGLNLFFLVFCPWWLSMFPDSIVRWIYNEQLGVGYVFLSNLLANALYLPFFGRAFLQVRFALGAEWKRMLSYALPLMVMGLAGVTNEMFSRVLLKYWLPEGFYPAYTNQEILGIFGGCYKLSVFMTLAIQAFRYAFEPFFFSKSGDAQSPQLFARVMHGFVIFGAFSWMLISIFLPEVAPILLRKPSYLTALEIVPLLLGGGLFLGIYYNLSVWYKLTDKTKYGAWITVLGAVLTLLLNFILIPVLGYMGSAWTTLAVYFVMVVVSYYLGQRHYPIPYFTGKGLFYIALAGLSIMPFYFCALSGPSKYFTATALLLLFVGVVWWLDLRKGTLLKKQL
ncbi:oligosaccharide flippase family protein [Marinoscillum furvescens]|uniref:O-antigen/teichoic acid export membrane protein n=1 Tax=Marinoscillum furvescens DSM 4134 TaxID=1122208 RepID=A0A3D9LHU8_MARFU|nr:oligosaccharide flippase family protein [Marinoscillum furvescens]REE05991.1 O-antigen/teichoic acid export membrane protein [Marinoscillum furvescens DSM 4134]